MVTYEEFKEMLQEKINEMSDPEAAFLVSRLVTYTDDLTVNRQPPLPPPTLPDLTKGDPRPIDGDN